MSVIEFFIRLGGKPHTQPFYLFQLNSYSPYIPMGLTKKVVLPIHLCQSEINYSTMKFRLKYFEKMKIRKLKIRRGYFDVLNLLMSILTLGLRIDMRKLVIEGEGCQDYSNHKRMSFNSKSFIPYEHDPTVVGIVHYLYKYRLFEYRRQDTSTIYFRELRTN